MTAQALYTTNSRDLVGFFKGVSKVLGYFVSFSALLAASYIGVNALEDYQKEAEANQTFFNTEVADFNAAQYLQREAIADAVQLPLASPNH